MANLSTTAKVTAAQLGQVVTAMTTANDNRFIKKTDKIAETGLETALATKINGKADSATTLDGYGITNAYTKTEIDTELNGKADNATTLNGYGITDAYTKAEVDAKISSAYKVKGSKTAAEITSALLVAANEGGVYNVSEEFTTTADFVEGAGKVYPAGTNVVVADAGGGSYKFDVLSGFVDVSALSETASSDTR